MRAPPAVSIDARPGTGWRLVQVLLQAAAAGAGVGWAAAWLNAPTLVPAMVAAWAAAVWGWRRSAQPDARLSWTGAQWWLATNDSEPCEVQPPQVMIDLHQWLLLRLTPMGGGAARWLALTGANAGAAWHLLRAAVYSPAPEPEPRSAEERPPF